MTIGKLAMQSKMQSAAAIATSVYISARNTLHPDESSTTTTLRPSFVWKLLNCRALYPFRLYKHLIKTLASLLKEAIVYKQSDV